MSFPNPIAATQGRGFGLQVSSEPSRMTRRVRTVVTLIALAAASVGGVGCQSVPMAHVDGSTARMIAVFDAAAADTAVSAYQRTASQGENVLLAGSR